jgi:hypothetical protein
MALRVFTLDQSRMTLLSGKIVIGEVEKIVITHCPFIKNNEFLSLANVHLSYVA